MSNEKLSLTTCAMYGYDAVDVAHENGYSTDALIRYYMSQWSQQEAQCERCQWRQMRRGVEHCYMFREIQMNCRKFQS